uniref:DUF4220 domain-containing protein n=1 Tax=Oryza brachyantha TaxID=4533 RepID=J3MI13_ORYBR
MGFSPPVPQNDSDWEIRVAMLLSLALQILLIFVGPMRKRSSHPLPRFAVWSCYLLADWVADLGLGLLLNNLGNIGGNSNGGAPSSTVSQNAHLLSSPGGFKRRGGGGGGSPPIFAFWTPFLLLHLGGPDTITAYSLEDNELWLRHLIGLLFELFSAFVVFSCSIRSNPMIPATALIFVVGIIKYGERTFSLYSGSVSGFRNNILGDPNPGPNYAKLMTEFDSKQKAGLLVEVVIADGEASKAKAELEEGEDVRLVIASEKSLEATAYDFFQMFRVLFVNLILSYKERRISQAYFLDRQDVTASTAFEVVEVELNFIYNMVYTKAPVSHTRRGCVLRAVATACLVVATVLFVLLDKAGIHPVDRGITYALLLGGLALDAAAFFMLLSSSRMLVYLEESKPPQENNKLVVKWLARVSRAVRRRTKRWSERTSQLNLISYCLGKPKEDIAGRWWCCRWTTHPRVMPSLIYVADKVGLRETLDDFFFIQRRPVSCRHINDDDDKRSRCCCWWWQKETKQPVVHILEHVFDGLKKTAQTVKDSDYTEMKKLCDNRGQGTLVEKEEIIKEQLTCKELLHVLQDSVRREFDESLLLWHIATDLCSSPSTSPSERQGADTGGDIDGLRSISETLSEYMLYLLVRQPEMLSATAGIGLLRYRDTCAEAKRLFKSAAAWEPGHQDTQRMLLAVNTSKKPADVKGDLSKSVLFDACILAKVLRQLDGDTMWRVVAGVWMEMLTYAAGRCHGSTHVRQLSRGGELITLVWFLMAHMGIGDMYRIHEGEAKAKLIVHDQ